MRRVLRLLPFAILSACGGGFSGPAAKESRYERVPLRLESPRPWPEPVVVRRLAPDRRLEGWVIESRDRRLVEHGDAVALHLRGVKPRRVRVATEVDQAAFDRVRVHGIFNARLTLSMRLIADDQVVHERMASVNHGPGPQVVRFDQPVNGHASGPVDAIELGVEGGGPFDLLAFELVRVPIAEHLPLPEDGPAIVPIGNESRSAVGLVSGHPLVGTLDVRHPSERLSFAVGVHPELRSRSLSGARVVATVGEGEGTRRARVAPPDGYGWATAEIELEPFLGREVPVRFELEGAGEGPAICALANVELSRPGAPAPSLLLVTSDTHRADHVGASGAGVRVDTPTLDQLAERGVLFTDAWSTTNVTSPSHVALMTGVHPRDTRLIANTGHLGDEAPTLAEAFAEAGWTTMGVVSVRHLGPRGIGLGQGFDRMRDPPGKPWDAEDAIDLFLAHVEETDGRPLFAWLHLFDAHDPYAPPASHDRKYYPKDKDPFDPSLPEPGWEVGSVPYHLLPVRDPEFPRAQYRAEVSYLDEQLARVIEHERLGKGWIAFTSDHGETLETQGTWFNHGELFPSTLHVPLILAGPDVPSGVRASVPVEQVHLGRTLLDLAGLGGVEFPGDNLLRVALDEEDGPAPTRYALSAGGFSAALTEGRWYLVMTLKEHKSMLPRARATHEVELYDLAADPGCEDEVSAEHPEVTRELRARLVEWLDSARPEGFARAAAVRAEDVEALAALGYAGDTPEVGERRWIDPACGCERCAPWR